LYTVAITQRPNTTAGLIEKCREISGQIEHHQRILNDLIIDLKYVDHTIHRCAPELGVSLAQPKQFLARHGAHWGERHQYTLGALRNADRPITTLEIAGEVATGRGLDLNDARGVSLNRKRVGACMYRLVEKGLAQEGLAAGTYKEWAVAR